MWLVSEDILCEYKEVLKRLRVRSHLIGRAVNLIRERAEEVKVRSFVEISGEPLCRVRRRAKAGVATKYFQEAPKASCWSEQEQERLQPDMN